MFVPVKSAEQYFEEYGRKRIGNGEDKWEVRRQMIKDILHEMEQLISLRVKQKYGDVEPMVGDPEAERIIFNVTRNTQQKWVKICKLFAMYKETANLLNVTDLNENEK